MAACENLFKPKDSFMCGRYSATKRPGFWKDEWGSFEVRYNICPSQEAFVLQWSQADSLDVHRSSWGIQFGDGPLGRFLINIRSETALKKFPRYIEAARCVVPACGFYEWETIEKQKRPVRFSLRSDEAFYLAGVVKSVSEGRKSFCLLTTTPNELVAKYHNRMPVILDATAALEWLRGEEAGKFFLPYPETEMTFAALGNYLNHAGVEGPRCWEPPEKTYRQATFF
jgi:putative SOS response-associated peptidase YedK